MPDYHPGGAPEQFQVYWTEGPGAAKIAWGADGDFDRCVLEVNAAVVRGGSKPLPDREIRGLCSNLHVRALGVRPGQE